MLNVLKANLFIGQLQFGFKRGYGTKEAIATYMLCERCLEHEQTVFVCYVDYKKAFHRVNWTGLMEILTEKQNQQELEEENGRCG